DARAARPARCALGAPDRGVAREPAIRPRDRPRVRSRRRGLCGGGKLASRPGRRAGRGSGRGRPRGPRPRRPSAAQRRHGRRGSRLSSRSRRLVVNARYPGRFPAPERGRSASIARCEPGGGPDPDPTASRSTSPLQGEVRGVRGQDYRSHSFGIHPWRCLMSPSNATGPVLWSIDARGVASVVLNRPEVNNAYDGALIEGLLASIEALSGADDLRAILVKSNGRHFQAGADLKWIDAVRQASSQENIRVSRATAEAVQRLNVVPVPTVALVHGGCFGGGTGIVAACDVAIATEDAVFSIAEVRWGLTAAIILPQLADAIGVRQLRRYALTGERFGAAEARRIGLVHEVVPRAELEMAGERMLSHMLENGPDAIAQTKALAMRCAFADLDSAAF